MDTQVAVHSMMSGNRCDRLDIRHLVVRPSDVHPGEANGVVGVARRLVREQRAAGEDARLIMIAHKQHSTNVNDLHPDPSVPTQLLPLDGITICGRVVRLRRKVTSRLLSDVHENTIFHIHGGREPLLAQFTRVLRGLRVPYAVTLHGRFSHIYSSDGRCQKPRTALYLKLLERGMLQGARFVQALSSEEAQVLHWIAPRARIEVVGNGAYSTKLDSVPTRPATRHPSGSFPHFVYCGRYAIYHKGLDLLIEGFAQYRREGGIGKLTMIGTGPERDTLARVAESLGITDVAEIGGPLFGEARDKALSRCDYFIMASRFEGVPLAALEAALLGMPLVVTEGTGLCSQVKENGAGVPIEALTAEAVCKALHRAAKFSIMEFAACGAAAFALAVAIGDWTAIARRLRVLYEEPNSSSFSIPAPVSARPA